MEFEPQTIYLDDDVAHYPLTKRVLSQFPETPVYMGMAMESVVEKIKSDSADSFGAGKRQLMLSRFKGSFLKKCPGISRGMVCCNYYVINPLSNCIYDCAYCFLQDFLDNNPLLVAYVNVEDVIRELDAIFKEHPNSLFRVGTGEITDSLALDHVLPYSDYLIPFFNTKENAVLELKTKSDRVENLLKQKDPKNVIVSWSINPQEIIDLEEQGTPGLEQRLEAARLCQEKGYRIGFHFDPIILYPGWETGYRELTRTLFDRIHPRHIEWISLGSFRYRRNLKQIIKERHRHTRLFTEEHVPCEDGKFRYLRPLRNRAYETIRGYLRQYSQNLNIYLCMETKEIWEGVTGKLPRSDKQLDQFFDL